MDSNIFDLIKKANEITLNNPTKEGYDFVKWIDSNNNEFSKIEKGSTGDKVFIATWSAKVFNITYYDSEVGTSLECVDSSYPINFEYDKEVSIPNASKEGYDFVGYKIYYETDSNLENVLLSGKDITIAAKTLNNDIIVIAEFKLKEYIVTFDANGGYFNVSENEKPTTIDVTVKHGETVSEITTEMFKEGYTFTHWYQYIDENSDVNVEFDFATVIYENITLKAHWTLNKYNVTFDANGGEFIISETERQPSIVQEVLHGEHVQVPSNPELSGYEFTHWYLYVDENSDDKVAFDFENTVITSNITLKAYWTIVTYKISYYDGSYDPLNPELNKITTFDERYYSMHCLVVQL